ncbi:hypothetical protein AB0I09_30715, partial [Streptosporangium canum]
MPESTVAQRATRAKKIGQAGVSYRVPAADELPEGPASVPAVISLLVNEGHLSSTPERATSSTKHAQSPALSRLGARARSGLSVHYGRGRNPRSSLLPAGHRRAVHSWLVRTSAPLAGKTRLTRKSCTS